MRFIALCLSVLVLISACRLAQVQAEKPAAAQLVEILPAKTIMLHEFRGDTLGPYERRELGFYQRGEDKLYFSCDFSGSIVKEGPVENHRMSCEISLDASIQSALHAAGTRPVPYGITLSGFGSYVFRQGVIYPLPYGELYRVEDLTRSDNQGQYALLKRVTRQEMGIEIPLDYSRQYIPIRWKDDVTTGGILGWSICRFWYAEEPDVNTKALRKVLRCWLNYPKVIPSEKELFPVMGSMIVEEGMILPVVDCGFKILKIVPPNVEKKVCGWVEIDPRPILLRTPLGRQLEKLEQLEKQRTPPEPPLAPIPDPKP